VLVVVLVEGAKKAVAVDMREQTVRREVIKANDRLLQDAVNIAIVLVMVCM
jgi:hypothetical protein